MQDSRDFRRTLKRTRKFVVDGVEVSVTTSKIIGEDEKKDEEMRFLRYTRACTRTHVGLIVIGSLRAVP